MVIISQLVAEGIHSLEFTSIAFLGGVIFKLGVPLLALLSPSTTCYLPSLKSSLRKYRKVFFTA